MCHIQTEAKQIEFTPTSCCHLKMHFLIKIKLDVDLRQDDDASPMSFLKNEGSMVQSANLLKHKCACS